MCLKAIMLRTLTWQRSLPLASKCDDVLLQLSRQVVGTGQFGSVRLVRHVPTGGLYALKVQRSNFNSGLEFQI